MNAADAIREFIAPLLPGWRIQFGRWRDGNTLDRYAVIRPTGGLPAALVREPQFSLMFIGAQGEDVAIASTAADDVVEAMRFAEPADRQGLVSIDPAEPVFWSTDDGRPVFEVAVSAITN